MNNTVITVFISIASWGNVQFEISENFIIRSIEMFDKSPQTVEIILTSSSLYNGFVLNSNAIEVIEDASFKIDTSHFRLKQDIKTKHISNETYLLSEDLLDDYYSMVYLFIQLPQLSIIKNFDVANYFYLRNGKDINLYHFGSGQNIADIDVRTEISVGNYDSLDSLSRLKLTEIGYSF